MEKKTLTYTLEILAAPTPRVLACTSSNSRVFSMANTAWSAKVVTNSTLLREWAHRGSRQEENAYRSSLAQERNASHPAPSRTPD